MKNDTQFSGARTLVAAVVLVFAACGSRGEYWEEGIPAWNTPDQLQAQLDRIMPELLNTYRVPGASVAVVLDGEVVLARGYGYLRADDTSRPVDKRTVFQAASLSKPVVAYGVHRLMAAQPDVIMLDSPLMGFRPPDEPYRHDDPRLEKVTVRTVLSHSTGFPNWRPDNRSDNPGDLKIRFEPGTRFRYSGEGYVYLQRVVEQISGEALDVYMRRTVLAPLGMAGSSFVWDKAFEDNHAVPHDGDGKPGKKRRPDRPVAAGTLHTSATDYARFLLAVLGEPPGGEGAEPWLAKVTEIDESLGWSLGWGFEQHERGDVFWQWGDDGPFKALAAGSRERAVGVVVFTNGHSGLNVARPVVELVLGPDLRFLDYRMLNYD